MVSDPDEMIMFKYASNHNITFEGEEESGYTREEWNELPQKAKDEAVEDFLWGLVDVWVDD